MPLDFKAFVQAMQFTPQGSTPEQAAQLVQQQAAQPSALSELMTAANRPLVGAKDSYFLQHEHSPDEGIVRKTAEDLGASLTSPLNLGLTAASAGASAAGKAGMLGISKGARIAEAALQAPLVAEGVHGMVAGNGMGEKLGGALEAGLGVHGMASAATHALPATVKALEPLAEEAVTPVAKEVIPSAGASTSPTTSANAVLAPGSPASSTTPLVKLQHRSMVGDLAELDPQKYGSGQAGAERRRQLAYPSDFQNRTYFTREGGQVEDRFSKAPHVYNASIPEDRLYDLGTDPQGFLPQAATLADGDHAHTITLAEKLVKDAGYGGYHISTNENPAMRDSVAMFEKTPVTPEQRRANSGLPMGVPSDRRMGELMDKFGGKGSTALAVASPAASSAIDDSDPNDPNQQLKHYGKLALDLVGAGAAGAAIRANIQSPQKAAASKGAAWMLLGGNKSDWAKRMVAEGIAAADVPKVRAASEKMLTTQLEKANGQMPNAKKLLAHFNTGKAEMGWYDDVHGELKQLFGEDAPLMANLLAATSSNSTVKSNTTLALKAYGYLKSGKDLDTLKPGEGFLPAVVMNIKKAVAGERLNGRKIDNFAQAIIGNPDAVVADRWMMRAFGFDKDVPTPHQYDIIEHAVQEMAQKQGVSARQMQAAIWFSVKTDFEKKAGNPRPSSPPYGELLKQKLAQKNLF